MNPEEIDDFLPLCLKKIEGKLGWGLPENWSHNDFEQLSTLLAEDSGVQLSVVTLKRLWGNLKYTSSPSTTTLNTLVLFIGFKNWRSFIVNTEKDRRKKQAVGRFLRKNRVLLGLFVLILSTAVWLSLERSPAIWQAKNNQFAFHSKKMRHIGVPNSVIFEYNLAGLPADVPVFIQQSWDTKRQHRILPGSSFHSSLYHYPGFYLAKLVVEDEVVKEEPLLIQSGGWISMIETNTEPLYLEPSIAQKHGVLGINESELESYDLEGKKEVPWVSYHLVKEFNGITSSGFQLETRLRNDLSRGDNICQLMEIHILFEGGAIMIPLSQPGCVSKLQFLDADGKIEPSKLGINTNDWVDVDFKIQEGIGKLTVNGQHIYDVSYPYPEKQFVGLRFRFKGSGQIDQYQITNDQYSYGENFDLHQENLAYGAIK